MPSKAVVLVIIAFIVVVLICSSYSQPALAKAIAISGITCQTNLGLSLKVECCQSFRDGKIETLWCTQCDNTVPPSNCGPRYQANRGVANPTGVPTPAGNALPPPGSDTGRTIKYLQASMHYRTPRTHFLQVTDRYTSPWKHIQGSSRYNRERHKPSSYK